jgi:hypothetical protein
MKLLRAFALFAFCAPVLSGAPDMFAQEAGPQPNESQARDAVIQDLKRTVKEPADFSRVRFLSGPHLVTGTNFAKGREQAWLMCVVEGTANARRAPLELEVKPYLLRTRAGLLEVVQAANWSDFENKC